MSTYLELCADLHREVRYPGTAPASVTGQTGQQLDIVSWVRDAYLDIQQAQDGDWKFLHHPFELATVAATSNYPSTHSGFTDTITAAAITRFHAWDLQDRYQLPKIYLTSAGQSAEIPLIWSDWDYFDQIYNLGTPQANSQPVHVTVNPQDEIVLGPTPNDVYTVRGNYKLSPQILAADSDEPEMPAHFHRLVWMEAAIKYAYNHAANEILQRMDREYTRLYGALQHNQSLRRMRMKFAEPLA